MDALNGEALVSAIRKIAEESEPPLTAGSCLLKHSGAAQIVQDALLFFEGNRYILIAWCIMPNHVHVVQPNSEHKLQKILHSWKSFTSKEINHYMGLHGILWERESFDHLIRSEDHIEHFVYYTEQNPVVAGFVKEPKDWKFSNQGANFQTSEYDFVDPKQLPFATPYDRRELPHLQKEAGIYFVTWRLLDAVELHHQ
jgi:REP element-mobilizing transposase RayT